MSSMSWATTAASDGAWEQRGKYLGDPPLQNTHTVFALTHFQHIEEETKPCGYSIEVTKTRVRIYFFTF